MLNPFKLKKYIAILLVGMITTVLFAVGTLYYGTFGGVGFFFIGMVLAVVAANVLLANPFTKMLEGKGILVLNVDSTGVIQPFIVGVAPPYIQGKLGRKVVKDVFDRSTVSHLAVPHMNSRTAQLIMEGENKGGVSITLDGDTYNKGRFALFHYPVIIYNEQIGTVVTKDFLANLEKDTFAEHTVLYLNRKMEELTSVVRDFGRHIVDTLKPAGNLLQSKWVWVIIAVFVIIMLALFGKPILNAIQGFSGGAGAAISSAAGATGGGAVTPVP